MHKQLTNPQTLRKNQTDVEKQLWSKLRNRQVKGFKFRRQQIIGHYIVDFICLERRIIIELDGGQHNEEENIKHDIERTVYLEKEGFKVFAFLE